MKNKRESILFQFQHQMGHNLEREADVIHQGVKLKIFIDGIFITRNMKVVFW